MSVEEDFGLSISDAMESLDTVEAKIQDIGNQTIDVTVAADTAEAESQLALFNEDLAPIDAVVELDSADAEAQLSELQSEDLAVGVDVEVTGGDEAATQLQEVAQAAEEVNGSQAQASLSADGLTSSLSGLSQSSGSATGAMAGLGAGVGEAAGIAGPAGIALAGVSAGLGVLATAGVEAADAQDVFNYSLGSMRSELETIDVGNFSANLSDIAIKLGSSDEALKLSTASLVNFGKASGASNTEIVKTTENIVALAARAVALNPRLGDVDQVTDALARTLQRGGPRLAQFGIDLTSAEINARALSDTGKTTAAELTNFEKRAAGAALATEKLGNSLDADIQQGMDRTGTKLEQVKEQVGELQESLGSGLVPILETSADAFLLVNDAAGILDGKLKTLTNNGLGLGDVLKAGLESTPVVGDIIRVGDAIGMVKKATEDGESSGGRLSAAFHSIATEAADLSAQAEIASLSIFGVGTAAEDTSTRATFSFEQVSQSLEDGLLNATTYDEAQAGLTEFADGMEDWQLAITGATQSGMTGIAQIIKDAGPVRGQQLADIWNAATPTERAALEAHFQQVGFSAELGSQGVVAGVQSGLLGLPQVLEQDFMGPMSVAGEDGGATFNAKLNGKLVEMPNAVQPALHDISFALGQGAQPLWDGAGNLVGARYADGTIIGLNQKTGEITNGLGQVINTVTVNNKGEVESKGSELGDAFGHGFWSGLHAWADSIAREAEGIGDIAYQHLGGSIRVGSPSKVAMELGEFFGQGFALGIEGTTDQVRAATESIAAASTDIAIPTGGTPTASQSFEILVNVPDTIGSIEQAQAFGEAVGDGVVGALAIHGANVSIRAGGAS